MTLAPLLAKISPQQEETGKTTSPFIELASSPLGALVVLLGVVLVHESGHYLAARLFGIHPEEFSIGFGPKLMGTQLFHDNFNLRAIPFGGYVRFAHETLLPLPWTERVVISSAGVIMNLILSVSIYMGEILLGNGLLKPVLAPGILVAGIQEEAKSMLRPGDVILSVNNKQTTSSSSSSVKAQECITDIIQVIQSTPDGESVEMSIARNNKEMDVIVTPTRASPDAPPTIGVFLEPNMIGVERLQDDSILQAMIHALQYSASIAQETALGLRTFLTDFVTFRKSQYQVRGPIGVLERASEVVSTQNMDTVLTYMASISINFAVINMVPIPPTDGFQIVLTVIQALRESI